MTRTINASTTEILFILDSIDGATKLIVSVEKKINAITLSPTVKILTYRSRRYEKKKKFYQKKNATLVYTAHDNNAFLHSVGRDLHYFRPFFSVIPAIFWGT